MECNAHPLHVLLIEDDQDIAKLIALHVSQMPAKVIHAADGKTGIDLAMTEIWDAIILDIGLPHINGLDICRHIRAQGSHVPILMLSAKVSELDRVLGLELGADDYLTKPFSVIELQARIKALVRRSQIADVEAVNQDLLSYANLRLNKTQRKSWLAEKELPLTAMEFDLLWFFASNPGRVFNRIELLTKVWGYGHSGYEHTVNSHINRLRSKLEEQPELGRFIHTVWGVGYRFEAAA